MYNEIQSVHKQRHSTETALAEVKHDIVYNLDAVHCVQP